MKLNNFNKYKYFENCLRFYINELTIQVYEQEFQVEGHLIQDFFNLLGQVKEDAIYIDSLDL